MSVITVKIKVSVGRGGTVRYLGHVLGRIYRNDDAPSGQRWCSADPIGTAITSHRRTQRAALIDLLRHHAIVASGDYA